MWRDKYFENGKQTEQHLQEINAKHVEIVTKTKLLDDADKIISRQKQKLKEYQIKSLKPDISWEDKKKGLEENILKEWKRKIQYDIEINVYKMLEEKLKQFEELLVETATDSESRGNSPISIC
jgi:hypothetical protein